MCTYKCWFLHTRFGSVYIWNTMLLLSGDNVCSMECSLEHFSFSPCVCVFHPFWRRKLKLSPENWSLVVYVRAWYLPWNMLQPIQSTLCPFRYVFACTFNYFMKMHCNKIYHHFDKWNVCEFCSLHTPERLINLRQLICNCIWFYDEHGNL